jgi:uncharacterized cupredoxin-like copper-binding protein
VKIVTFREVRVMRVRVPLLVAAVLVVLPVLVAACGGGSSAGGGGTTVTMTEFKFDPANLTVKRGQEVVITLQNKGTVVHDWNVQDLGVSSPKVQPGQSATVRFTPQRTGTFKIECLEPGHAEAGMVGQLTVTD